MNHATKNNDNMKSQSWIRKELINLLIIIVPFIFIALKWNDFPDKIPMHWNIKGEIDNYGSRAFGLLALPGMNILMYLLFLFIPKIDPKKSNYPLFEDKWKIIRTVIHLFILVMFFVIAFVSLGYNLPVDKIVMISVILLMLLFGNYMGNIRHNYFIGIKTPWTLANENVWRLTHRIAGKIWVISSVIMLAIVLLIPRTWSWTFFIYIGIITIIPIVYSYIKFKEIEKSSGSSQK
jgi:uncharacterized membrane protein